MNFLNDFRTESARNKHYGYCSGNGEVKIDIPDAKDNWLEFYDFESILKPNRCHKEKIEKLKVALPY